MSHNHFSQFGFWQKSKAIQAPPHTHTATHTVSDRQTSASKKPHKATQTTRINCWWRWRNWWTKGKKKGKRKKKLFIRFHCGPMRCQNTISSFSLYKINKENTWNIWQYADRENQVNKGWIQWLTMAQSTRQPNLNQIVLPFSHYLSHLCIYAPIVTVICYSDAASTTICSASVSIQFSILVDSIPQHRPHYATVSSVSFFCHSAQPVALCLILDNIRSTLPHSHWWINFIYFDHGFCHIPSSTSSPFCDAGKTAAFFRLASILFGYGQMIAHKQWILRK